MKYVFVFVFFICAVLVIGRAIGIAVFHDEKVTKSDRVSIYAPMSHSVSEGYSTIVIDSCEYIEAYNRLAHKGNCKFCVERRKKEIKFE